MDVRGSEERGRWRQPDEGTGGAQRITPPVPSPQPLSRRERGSASQHYNCCSQLAVKQRHSRPSLRHPVSTLNTPSSAGNSLPPLPRVTVKRAI